MRSKKVIAQSEKSHSVLESVKTLFKNWLHRNGQQHILSLESRVGRWVRPVMKYKAQLIAIFEKHNDATITRIDVC